MCAVIDRTYSCSDALCATKAAVSAVNRPRIVERRVERLVDTMSGGVDTSFFRAWFHKAHFVHRGLTYFDDGRIFSGADERQQRGAIRGSFFTCQYRHANAENIRQHLAPECAPRAAAGNTHGVYSDPHPLDDVQPVFLTVGHTLQ